MKNDTVVFERGECMSLVRLACEHPVVQKAEVTGIFQCILSNRNNGNLQIEVFLWDANDPVMQMPLIESKIAILEQDDIDKFFKAASVLERYDPDEHRIGRVKDVRAVLSWLY